MARFQDLILTELGETTDGYEWRTSRPGREFSFNTENYKYMVEVSRTRPKALQISFSIGWEDIEGTKNPYSMKTNEGNQFRIVATVVDVTKHVWKNRDAFYRDAELLEYITFEGSGPGEDARQREKLYLSFVQKQFPDAEVEEGLGNHIRVKPKQ